MARFVSLTAVALAAMCLPTLRAQTTSTTPQTAPASQVKTPPAKTPATPPATNAAASVTPAGMERYGNIVVPTEAAAYPVKLKLPFPGAGEVKVPSADEMAMREKLEALAELSDQEIHVQLEQWPVYGKMTLRDQGAMLQRIQDFRDYRSRTAMQAAHDLGLTALTPEQKPKFEKEYWDKRLKMDEDMAKQFTPIFQARQQKMQADLLREFAASAIAQGPKLSTAPTPAPANKPATNPATSTVAQAPR